MEVILKKDVSKIGKAGDVVEVKKGFARNFLLAQGLALPASAINLKVIEREKEKQKARLEQEKDEMKKMAVQIAEISCTITVKAGEDGKLFGSVTNQDIAAAYRAEGVEIDKRKINLPEPIKEVGVFKVEVKLHPEITAEAKIWVVKE